MQKLASTALLAVFSLIVGLPLTGYADTERHYTDPTLGIEFIYLQSGSFVMGDILSKNPDATPPHRVNVTAFGMAMHEITFSQYDQYCEATGQPKPEDRGWGRSARPVINVSWQDAKGFAEWLSQKNGRTFRLPSEAEWEYAARAGQGRRYWWGNTMEINMANCAECGSRWANRSTAPVGSFASNPWGIFDMSGNVHEWTLDTVVENYTGAPETAEARLDGDQKQRIVRGGSYNSSTNAITVYARDWFPKGQRSRDIGFRLVIED